MDIRDPQMTIFPGLGFDQYTGLVLLLAPREQFTNTEGEENDETEKARCPLAAVIRSRSADGEDPGISRCRLVVQIGLR